jgi:hypothetical protein
LLSHVRTAARRPETLAVHGESLADLARDFQRECPWVRAVEGIETAYPNRLVVHLEYRKPVAFLRTAQNNTIFLDRDGVVLPEPELDRSACGPLVRILPEPGATVAEPRGPGLLLRLGPGRDGSPGDAAPAQAAAGLAGFLLDQQAAAGSADRVPKVLAIHDQRGALWMELNGPCLVLWTSSWANPPPGEPSPGRKWAALRDWFARNNAASLKPPNILVFDRDRAVLRRGPDGGS